MNKRGISAVVANVLIVLLVIAGVAVMWGFIYPVLKDTGNEIDITQFSLFLEILPNSVEYDSTNGVINFTVYRKAGSGNLSGIVILLEDSDGTNAKIDNDGGDYALKELESISFSYDYSDINGVVLEDIRKISVAPIIIKSSGENETLGVTDVFLLGDNDERDYTCGDGTIDVGEQCEGDDLDGETCESQGCSPGTLSCYAPGEDAECNFDFSGCGDCGSSGNCTFTEAYWKDSSGNILVDLAEINVGDNVNINLETDGCIGEIIRFELRESDGGDGDFILSFGDKVVDSTENVSFDWATNWTNDDLSWPGDDNPEYKFKAILSSDTSTTKISDRIKIISVCGNNEVEDSIELCDEGPDNGVECDPGEVGCSYCSADCTQWIEVEPPSCVFENVFWMAQNGSEIASATEGDTVFLVAMGNEACGITTGGHFELWEDDVFVNDDVENPPEDNSFNELHVLGSFWIAEYHDEWGDNENEYVFKASLVNASEVESEPSPILYVSPLDTGPVCGDGDDVCSEGSTQSCDPGDGYAGEQDCLPDCTGWGSCSLTEFCGDNEVNGPEACDGNNLNGETCVSQGYDSGSLSCTAGCQFDTFGCQANAVCGDGNVGGPEECEYEDMCCDSSQDSGGTCTWESGLQFFSGNNFQLVPDSCMSASEYYTVASLNNDLVAWFRFEGESMGERLGNDGSSGDDIDSENSGIYVSDGGKYGGAYSFPGGGDKEGLSFSDDGLPMGDSPRTVSGWVKYASDCGGGDGVSDRQVMFGYGNTGSEWRGMFVGREDNGKISLGLVSGNYMKFGSEGDLCVLNTWYHLAITYDGFIFKAYINGTVADCTGSGGGGGQTLCDENDFTLLTDYATARIGSRRYARTMNGSIDEVMVFSRALTASEVSALYNAGNGTYTYPFDANGVQGYLVESSAIRPAEVGT